MIYGVWGKKMNIIIHYMKTLPGQLLYKTKQL